MIKVAARQAFPDYSKALVSQRRDDPARAGRRRAVGAAAVGAALGGAAGRLMSDKAKYPLLGAALGALAGGRAGYVSGRNEAESDYSRLLFLRRRAGINEPGELDALLRHPGMADNFIVGRQLKMAQAAAPSAQPAQPQTPTSLYQQMQNRWLPKFRAGKKPQPAAQASAPAAKPGVSFAGVLPARGAVKTAAAGPMLSAFLKSKAAKGALIAGAGGGGYLLGSEVMPHVSGYADDPSARRISGFLDGTAMAALAGAGIMNHRLLKNPRFMGSVAGGVVGGEVIPVGVATMNRMSGAMKDVAAGSKDQAIPLHVRGFLRDSRVRGALAGTMAAGIGAMTTGLTRPKTDKEIREDDDRAAMVRRDLMRYLAPAVIGGALLGGIGRKSQAAND